MCLGAEGCLVFHTARTFSAAATLRTAIVAAAPLAAKPETLFLSFVGFLDVSPLVPAAPSVAGARLSPATHDAYDPAGAPLIHVSIAEYIANVVINNCFTL